MLARVVNRAHLHACMQHAQASLSTLVVGEHRAGQLMPSTMNTMAAAQQLGTDVTLLLAGNQMADAVQTASQSSGADRTLYADDPCLAHNLAEPHAALLVALQRRRRYTHILAVSSDHGKNVLPRAAALLDVQPVSNVIKILGPRTFVRPIYAGNVLETVQLPEDRVSMLTVRASTFEGAAPAAGREAPIEAVAADEVAAAQAAAGKCEWVTEHLSQDARPDLASAKIVVAGGRGLRSAEGFRLLQRLADRLGAAIGASRPAIDLGFVGNDSQVGQTGRVIAPDLYIAVGISGAIHHLAGMKDSKCIVAINSDPEAPIFQVADYGLVGDLFEILPELESRLRDVA